jgi:hypothetical protein
MLMSAFWNKVMSITVSNAVEFNYMFLFCNWQIVKLTDRVTTKVDIFLMNSSSGQDKI